MAFYFTLEKGDFSRLDWSHVARDGTPPELTNEQATIIAIASIASALDNVAGSASSSSRAAPRNCRSSEKAVNDLGRLSWRQGGCGKTSQCRRVLAGLNPLWRDLNSAVAGFGAVRYVYGHRSLSREGQ